MIRVWVDGQEMGRWEAVNRHADPLRDVNAASLKRAYSAGVASRSQDLERDPPYDDADLNLAWVAGYDAATRFIEENE